MGEKRLRSKGGRGRTGRPKASTWKNERKNKTRRGIERGREGMVVQC